MAIVVKEENYIDMWYLNIDATKYLTLQKDWFSTYKPLKHSLSMFIRINGSQKAIGVGTIFICFHTNHISKVPNVIHVLHLAKNLMSIYAHDGCIIHCCNSLGHIGPLKKNSIIVWREVVTLDT